MTNSTAIFPIGLLLATAVVSHSIAAGNGIIIWKKDDSALEAEYGIQVNKYESSQDGITQKPAIINPPSRGIKTFADDLANTKVTPLLQEIESFYRQYQSAIPEQEIVEDKPASKTVKAVKIDGKKSLKSLYERAKQESKKDVKGRLSLDRAIEFALDYQYKIKASVLDLEKIKLLEGVAAGNWYPQINYKHSQNLKELFGQVKLDPEGNLTQKDPISTKYTTGFQLKQNLNIKQLRLSDSRSILDTKAETYKLEQTKQILSLAVAELFLSSLHFKDKVNVSDEFQGIVKDLRALVELRYKAGKVTLLDKKKMELNLELTLAEQEHFRTESKNANIFLSRAIGVKSIKSNKLVPVKLGVENFDKYRLFLQDFVEDNVGYLQSANNVAIASNTEENLEANLLPSVEVNASLDRNKAIVGQDYTRSSLLLDISYSVWSGGVDKSRLKSSKIGTQSSQYRLEATKEEVYNNIKKSFSDYEQSVRQYKTQHKNRLVSWDLFNIQYEAFKIGKEVNLIELVGSLSLWYNNYLKSKQAYYDANSNKNKFSTSIGRAI